MRGSFTVAHIVGLILASAAFVITVQIGDTC
jgi:hypothetical protein